MFTKSDRFFSVIVLNILCYISLVESIIPRNTSEGLIFCCPENKTRVENAPPVIKRNSMGQRISEEKCLEYSNCGDLPQIHSIVGGTAVREREFPHMAAIGWRQTGKAGYIWNCGGSLISEKFVLTAAHCSSSRENLEPVIVRLGERDLEFDDGNEQDIFIESIYVHPEYSPPVKYHDIALLKLARPASLNEFVRPLCLWRNQTFDTGFAIATGWGSINYTGPRSSTLQKVELFFHKSDECQKTYQSQRRTLPRGIITRQLCVGYTPGNRDTCQGDSGGPLTFNYYAKKCVHYQLGITSFGIGCGSPVPAVYTKVPSYLDWIESVVWP